MIKTLYPYVRDHRAKIIGAIILSFVLAGLKAWQAYLVKPIFDQGLSSTATFQEALQLAFLLLGLMALNFPCRFYHFYWLRFVVDQATCSLRAQIFQKMQRLPLKFFIENKQGTLISNLLNDTNALSQGFKGSVDIIREPLTAIFMLGLAVYRDWQLTLVILATAPFFVWIFQNSGKKVKQHQADVQEELGNVTHAINEGLAGHKIIKAFNLQQFVSKRFEREQGAFFRATMRTTKVEEWAHPMVEFIGAVAFSGIIVFAHHRIKSAHMTTGDFVSFITAMALLMDPIRKYSQANIKLNQAQAAAKRLFGILDTPEEPNSGTFELNGFKQEIKIENLSFSYGHHEVLSNFSLTIKKGQKVALVGPSGSGKSTIVSLLLGLYKCNSGRITIDGMEIGELNKQSLRSLFALVSQDMFLFNDTVNANLSLDREYSEAKLWEALKVAYADDFVAQLPLKLNTVLGDRGTKLSGGQQQRLTIARAFLRQSEVLLFDEATSALDNESEKVVQKALDGLAGGHTVLAVAHRLTTIKNYDLIVVMQNGRVIEQGTHSELMSKGGEYARLWSLGESRQNSSYQVE